MADEIGSLLVRIDAEDNASAVLARVSGSVSSLSGASAAGTKSVSGLTGAMDAGKTTAESYRSKMADAAKAVSDKKTALDSAKTAYKATTKEAEKNTAALKSQKSSVESLIRAKQSEIDALEHSNTVINKGSQAYKDNQKAIEWTRTELRDLEAQHKSITQSMDAHEASVAKASRAYEAARTEVETAEKTYAKYTSGLDAVEKAEQAAAKAANAKNWEDAGKAIKDVDDGIDTLTKPFQYAAVGAIAGGVAVSKAAMDYETAFTGVRKTLDGTPEQLEAVNSEIRQMAKEIPVSAAGLADIAAIGGQLGVGAEDITKFTKTIAAMGVSTDLAGEEGAAALARIQTVTGDTMANVDRTASSIVALGNSTAATESEIAYMAVRMGKYGNTVGMNTQQVLGYSAALSSMGIEAQLGGSAIGRTWLDIETAVNSGGDALEAYAKYAGTTAQEFAQQWSTDPSGAFSGLIKGLSTTENLTQAMADLGIVNTQDQQVVMALANGYDLLTDCLTTSSTAYAENTALAKEAGAAYGTTANQIQLAKNDIVDAAISWGNVLLPEIRSGAQWVGDLAEGFGNLDDGTKRAVISGAKTAVVIGGISKATVGAVKGIGGLVEGVGQIKTALSAGGALAKFAPALTAIGTAAGPVALAIGGITAAVVVGKKAYDAYKDSQLNLLPDMEQGISTLNTYKSNIEELTALQKEASELQAKIHSGDINDEEYAAAVSRLNEIKQILSEKYHINVDTGDIDSAITKAKTLQRTMAASEAQELADSIVSDKGQFDENKSNLISVRAEQRDFERLSEGARTASEDLEYLHRTYEAGGISQQEYHNGALAIIKDFNKLSTDNTRREFAELAEVFDETTEYSTASYGSVLGNLKNIESGAERVAGGLKENADELSQSIDGYTQKTKQFADNALLWLAFDSQSHDAKAVTQDLDNLSLAVQNAGLSTDYYAKQASYAMNGVEGLNDAWQRGEEAVSNVAENYMQVGQQLGMTAEQAQLGGALIKSGFEDMAGAAATDGGLEKVVANFKDLSGQSEVTGEQLTALSYKLGLLPTNKKIEIDAEGNISIVETVAEKVRNLDGKTFAVTVNTEGDTSGADEVDSKVNALDGKKCVITFTADGKPAIATIDGVEYKLEDYNSSTGTATLVAEGGEAIATINLVTGEINAIPESRETNITMTADTSEVDGYTPENKEGTVNYKAGSVEGPRDPTAQGTINWITGTSPTTVPPASGQANYSLGTHPTSAPNISGTASYEGDFPESAPTITGTVIYNAVYGSGQKVMFEAKGTQNFPGGLAMVNDQKGIPDPRELIIDNGRAFIPQGKDVILPLSKGAKVYTARQTKRIMRNMGIPHYAEGKSNSDAFTAASDDWTHYTKTHAVTVTEELEKWVELSGEFTANIKDAEDIEERLYSLTRERREELNELSEEYISDRSFFNDWDSWGDSAIEAFDRVRDREYAYVADSKITEKEAADYLAELGKDMYDQRVENSEAWIDKQIRYNDMSVEDTKAAYDRMAAYTQEYYDNGLISYREYIEGMEEFDEQRTERLLDAYNVDDNRAQRYKQMAEVFGFDEGDNLVKTIGRELDNLDKAYADGAFRGSDEDYWDKRAELLIEQRNAEFDEWQTAMDKERTLYDLWDMWDSIGGKTGWLEDYAKRLQQFRKEEKISEKEFRAEMLDVYVEYYNAQEEALDEALQAQSDYIDSVNEKYDNLINKKEDAFDMKSLNDDIAEQQRKAEIYEGAVTQRGQDVYNDAVDRLEELQHQKEIKELQEEQTKVVSGLKTDYDKIEQNKKQILNGLSAQFIDVNAIASAIKTDTAGTQELLRAMLAAVRNIPGGNVYGDTNYNISGADTSILSAFMRRGVNAISGF